MFEGNPAAVVPLAKWLADDVMQKIASENNLSETAFFVPIENGYRLRWFTPTTEIDMCGHATLASAYVLFEELGYDKKQIVFESNSGQLRVKKEDGFLVMDFPAQKIEKTDVLEHFAKAFGKAPKAVYKSMDYIAIYEDEAFVQNLTPDMSVLKTLDLRGVIVTAKGKECDFVCRFFAPKYGIDEDPVTGAAYTQLVTLWSQLLGKTNFFAKQLSARGGEVSCELHGDRCILKGKAVKYMQGEIFVLDAI